MTDLNTYLTVAEEVVEAVEQLSLYWDAKGLDMHIAVKENEGRGAVIVVSTKHWTRVHYLETGLESAKAWEALLALAKKISRTLVASAKGPYVYIPKLSAAQTQNVFNHLKTVIKEITGEDSEVTRVWEMSWEIEDAVGPPGSEWA